MKIIMTAKNNSGIESELDPRFGRANYFGIVDTESMDVNFIENSAAEASSGAGVGAAQLVADQKVEVVISGNFGPKAFNALNAANIRLYSSKSGTLAEVVEEYYKGNLKQLSNATNDGHMGIK